MGKRIDSLRHAWSIFTDRSDEDRREGSYRDPFGYSVSYGGNPRPDRIRVKTSNERSIIASIYNRMAVDCSAVIFRHVRLDADGQFDGVVQSGLHNCLNVEANLDQAGRFFRQDIFSSLFDKGTIVIAPTDTSLNPESTYGYEIDKMRVGEIVKWKPNHIRMNLYNERTGRQEEVTLEKRAVAIVENPFYNVMNEKNSTLQRLIRKLNLLDAIDEQSGSGRLDIIIQLPYVVKTDTRRAQAEGRRKDHEQQLKGSTYGIAYTDGTEKVTQLNRPTENNLLKQIEYLMVMLYGELGITPEIMNGTADEAAMLNYFSRTIKPVLDAVKEEMLRKFISKTARTQGQTLQYFRDPFELVPIDKMVEMANQLSRNEIATANELRPFFNFKKHSDPKADMLINSNINPNPAGSVGAGTPEENNNQEGD